jgi:hypothetical protein
MTIFLVYAGNKEDTPNIYKKDMDCYDIPDFISMKNSTPKRPWL